MTWVVSMEVREQEQENAVSTVGSPLATLLSHSKSPLRGLASTLTHSATR